ncbi:hypothetical protein ACH492_02175 [Streptomyces sp. NPDC019443]|uniref:hypothetical protein n=1 Tax=Streptomyces sp. NPDC019443 TaxID=3365061 RepID=UPI00379D0705
MRRNHEPRALEDLNEQAPVGQGARDEYTSAIGDDGKVVDISFATQNWQKAVVDRTRPGQFVRRHFEAMVFTYLAEELRTGDVAVVGSEEYGDWSKQLLPWDVVEEKLPAYLVEVGLCEESEAVGFDAASFRRQLEVRLRHLGFPTQRGRKAAIRHLVLQAPAPVVAACSATTTTPPPSSPPTPEEPCGTMPRVTTHGDHEPSPTQEYATLDYARSPVRYPIRRGHRATPRGVRRRILGLRQLAKADCGPPCACGVGSR